MILTGEKLFSEGVAIVQYIPINNPHVSCNSINSKNYLFSVAHFHLMLKCLMLWCNLVLTYCILWSPLQ